MSCPVTVQPLRWGVRKSRRTRRTRRRKVIRARRRRSLRRRRMRAWQLQAFRPPLSRCPTLGPPPLRSASFFVFVTCHLVPWPQLDLKQTPVFVSCITNQWQHGIDYDIVCYILIFKGAGDFPVLPRTCRHWYRFHQRPLQVGWDAK